MLEHIREYTVAEAHRAGEERASWDVSLTELKAFIALLYVRGADCRAGFTPRPNGQCRGRPGLWRLPVWRALFLTGRCALKRKLRISSFKTTCDAANKHTHVSQCLYHHAGHQQYCEISATPPKCSAA